MKTIILTEEHFTEEGVFKAEEYFNAENNRYEFHGNLKVKMKYSRFEKSIYVKGYQNVKGDQNVEGNQNVEGYQYVKGDQYVKGYQLLKSKGSITINHIGSRKSNTIFYFTKENGIMVRCGCYWGSIIDFESRVLSTHNDNQYTQEYFLAIEYVKKSYEMYKNL